MIKGADLFGSFAFSKILTIKIAFSGGVMVIKYMRGEIIKLLPNAENRFGFEPGVMIKCKMHPGAGDMCLLVVNTVR